MSNPSATEAFSRRVVRAAGLGVVIPLTVLTAYRLGWDVIYGDPAIWQLVGSDMGGGLAAFRMFINDPWHLNPFIISSIGDGVAITLTDSIALLALIAKVLNPIGLRAEQWLALWVTLLPAANGLAGFVAIRAFRPRALIAATLGGLIIGLTPFALFRVVHPGLASHVTILLGIAGIGWMQRQTPPRRTQALLILLPAIGFMIHPYLAPMTGLTAGAAILTGYANQRVSTRGLVTWIGGVLGSLGVILLASGMHTRDVIPDLGGPLYSSNLFSPVAPLLSDLWPGGQLFPPRTSLEGFAWIGAGAALIVVFGAVVLVTGIDSAGRVAQVRSLIARHRPALTAAIVGFGLAISTRIEYGTSSTLDLRDRPRIVWAALCAIAWFAAPVFTPMHPRHRRRLRTGIVFVFVTGWFANGARQSLSDAVDPVMNAFRANGRFMWIPAYLLVIAGVVILTDWAESRQRRQPRAHWMLASLMVVAVVMQYADTVTLQGSGTQRIFDEPASRAAYMPDLINALGNIAADQTITTINLYPDYGCTQSFEELEAYRDTVIAASWVGLGITGDYSARMIYADCDVPIESVPGTRLVVLNEYLSALSDGDADCTIIDRVAVCYPAGD